MARTERQIAADDALTVAIEEACRAYDMDERNLFMSDYIVIVARQGVNEGEEDLSAYDVLYPGGTIPMYRALGLIEAGKMTMTGVMTQDD